MVPYIHLRKEQHKLIIGILVDKNEHYSQIYNKICPTTQKGQAGKYRSHVKMKTRNIGIFSALICLLLTDFFVYFRITFC